MTVSLLSVIIIFIQILFIEINSENTFDCTGYEDDSFHPMYNTDNCRYYWHCIYVNTVYMRAVKRVCPAGTEFDVRLKECEISSLVKCTPLTSPPLPTTTIHAKLFLQQQRLLIDQPTTTEIPQKSKVLSSTLSLEQLFENLIALKEKSEVNNTATNRPPKHIKNRRRNLTLNVLTSNEHKIRHFSLNQTHGLLIHCNEIRRRQLRDIIFRTTTNSTKISNLSSKIFHYDLLSLIIFINLFLIFTKISD